MGILLIPGFLRDAMEPLDIWELVQWEQLIFNYSKLEPLDLTDDDSELHLDFDQKKFDPHILHPKQL